MENEDKFIDKVNYNLTDKTKKYIKEYLRKKDDVVTMYDDGHDSLYVVQAGLGGRVAILGNEMILRSIKPNTFTELTDLVLEEIL